MSLLLRHLGGKTVSIKWENMWKHACFNVSKYLKARVSMYFLHLVLKFPTQNDIGKWSIVHVLSMAMAHITNHVMPVSTAFSFSQRAILDIRREVQN